MHPHQRLAAIAARQHGAFTQRQAMRAGFTRAGIRQQVRTGLWLPIHRTTYVLAGAPRTWERDVVAAVLSFSAGAAASHLTAAVLHGLLEERPDEIEVTVRHGRMPSRRGVVTHQARTLRRADVGRVSQISVTSPARTLVDVAGQLIRPRLEAVVDTALLTRRVRIKPVLAFIEDRGLQRCAGVGALGEILLDRLLGVPESQLEREFEELVVRRYNLPMPVRQNRAAAGRIDYAYRDQRIMIELDSAGWHSSAESLRNDCRRQNALVLDGWFPLHYTRDDVLNRHKAVADEVWDAIAARSRERPRSTG